MLKASIGLSLLNSSLQLDLYLSNANSLSFYDVYLLVELPPDNSVGYEGKNFFSWPPPYIGYTSCYQTYVSWRFLGKVTAGLIPFSSFMQWEIQHCNLHLKNEREIFKQKYRFSPVIIAATYFQPIQINVILNKEIIGELNCSSDLFLNLCFCWRYEARMI